MSGKVAEAAILQGAASGGLSSDSGFDPQLDQKPQNISHWRRTYLLHFRKPMWVTVQRMVGGGQEWKQLESCKV